MPLKNYDALHEAPEDAADAEALRFGRAEETTPMSMADRLHHSTPFLALPILHFTGALAKPQMH